MDTPDKPPKTKKQMQRAASYQDNREEVRKPSAAHYQDNREEIRKRSAAHYQDNREEILERNARAQLFMHIGLVPAVPGGWARRLVQPPQRPNSAVYSRVEAASRQKQSTATDGGSLDGNQSVAPSRCRFKKTLRSLARNQSHRAEPMHRA
jgi:hypothetical protein